MRVLSTIVLLSLVCLSQAAVRLSTVLSASEQENFKNLFQVTPYTDVAHAYYAVSGISALSQGGAVPASVSKAACETAKAASTKSLESMFYATSVAAALKSSCKFEFPASAINSVEKKIADGVDVQTLYYSVSILSNVGKKFSSDDVLGFLTKALAEDDSVSSASLGILTALKLDAKTDIKPLLQKSLDVEDMVAQADEVDEKYLHFENDLRTTSTFIRAVFELARKTKQPVGITEDQVIMLSNFILRFKNPSSFANAYNAIVSLDAVIQYQGMKLAKVQLISGNAVSQEKGTIKVSVLNLLAQPVEGITVKADSVTRTSDNEVIISNVPLKKSITAAVTTYNLNMWDLKPKSGFYDITLNVVSTLGTKLAGLSDIEFKVKVTTKVDIVDAKIGTLERESTKAEWEKITFPAKAPGMKADSQQKVVMTFKVLDTIDNTVIKPHQVFVLFQNVQFGQEVIFIAEPDSNSIYNFEVDLHAASKDQFAGRGGAYTIHLIVGDAAISNPIMWHLGDIELSFPGATPTPSRESIYTKAPEIHHMFRVSEKRPPAAVSTIFTFACIAPLFILVISWLKTGLNLSNLSLVPKNLIFHSGLIGIFVVYYLFWVKLTMFTTLRYLVLLGAITFLAGNKVLSAQQSVQ